MLQFGLVFSRQPINDGLALRCQVHLDLPPIIPPDPPLDQPGQFAAADQSDDAIMARLQALGQLLAQERPGKPCKWSSNWYCKGVMRAFRQISSLTRMNTRNWKRKWERRSRSRFSSLIPGLETFLEFMSLLVYVGYITV